MTTTPVRETVACALCGTLSEQPRSAAAPQSPGGPPDFDTRPAPPERFSILESLASCPACGYCADDITKLGDGVADIVREPQYQAIVADAAVPERARRFLCFGLILERLHQWADAGWSSLHAAWSCDDEGAERAALACRTLSLVRWKRAKELGASFGDDLASEFALATDLYRRSEDWENATVTCAEALDMDDLPPLVEALLRRQQALIGQRDSSAHSLAELLRSKP